MTGPVPPPNVTFGHTKPFGTYVPLGPVFPVTTGAPVGPGALVPPRPGGFTVINIGPVFGGGVGGVTIGFEFVMDPGGGGGVTAPVDVGTLGSVRFTTVTLFAGGVTGGIPA